MKRIPPFVRQPADSVWCGVACAAMILQYFGERITLKKVVDEINIYGARGVTIPKLASYFLRKNMRVIVQTWPMGIRERFYPTTQLSGAEGVEALRLGEKMLTSKARLFSKELIPFVKRGGNVIFKPITLHDIRERLKDSLVIANVNVQHFVDWPRKEGHYISF